jgi:hypothetical protein
MEANAQLPKAEKSAKPARSATDETGQNNNSDRFPDVDWYCDKCGEHLNGQAGFDDHRYTWKCE